MQTVATVLHCGNVSSLCHHEFMDALTVILIVTLVGVLGISVGYFAGKRSGSTSSLPQVESGLNSLSDAIDRMNNQVASQYAAGAASATELRTELLTSLANHTQNVTNSVADVRQQAARLTSVLNRTGARGRWGEMELRRLVEAAGLMNRVHFIEQGSFTTDTGTLRPDLQVNLSDDRCILVDAKTPMDSYLAAAHSTDISEIDRYMLDHSKSVIAHIDSLSRKSYAGNVDQSIDFVVMFLPSESLLESALQYRPDLLDYAFSRNVVPATPTTLYALLRGVGMSWKNNDMMEQAQEIAKLSRELYTRVDVVFSHFNKLGKSIQSAVANYNLTARSLDSRVRPTGQKLADLGVHTDKNLSHLTETPELESHISDIPPQLNAVNE
jgi:DNA recombination protein RmuC